MNIIYIDNIVSEQIQSYQRCKNKLRTINSINNDISINNNHTNKNKKNTSKSIYFTFEKNIKNIFNNGSNIFPVEDYNVSSDLKEIEVCVIYEAIGDGNYSYKTEKKALSLQLKQFNPHTPNVYIDKYECHTPYKAGKYNIYLQMIVSLHNGRTFASRKQINCVTKISENNSLVVDRFTNYSHRKMINNRYSPLLTLYAKNQLLIKNISNPKITKKTKVDKKTKKHKNNKFVVVAPVAIVI